MKRSALLLCLLGCCGVARADPPPVTQPQTSPAPGSAASAPAGAAPPSPAPSKPAPPPPAPPPPAPTTKIAASGILGRAVVGPDGKEIGRVVDVMVDAGSNPRAAVIDVGGFLGVGARRIAVNWSDLTFPPTGSETDIKLDLTSEQISSAPAYTDQTKPASVVEPPPLKPASPAAPAGH